MMILMASIAACGEPEVETETTVEETSQAVAETTVNTSEDVEETSEETTNETDSTDISDYIIADEEDRTWDLYVDTEEEQAQARQDVEDGNLSGYVVYDGAGNRITNDDGTYESHEVNATANEDTPYADYENPPDIEEEE